MLSCFNNEGNDLVLYVGSFGGLQLITCFCCANLYEKKNAFQVANALPNQIKKDAGSSS